MPKLLLILALLCPMAFADTPIYTHDFTSDADSSTLPAGWVVVQGTMDIHGGKLRCTALATGGNPCIAKYTGATVPAKQYVTIKASTWATSLSLTAFVRIGTSTAYGARFSTASGSTGTTGRILRLTDFTGSYSSIQTVSSISVPNTSSLTIKAIGTSLSIWKDGTTQLGTTSTDSNIASGAPGVDFVGSSTTDGITYFETGSVGAADPVITPSSPVPSGTVLTFSTAPSACNAYIKYTSDGTTTPDATHGTTGTTYTVTTAVTLKVGVVGCPSNQDSSVITQAYAIGSQSSGMWVTQ